VNTQQISHLRGLAHKLNPVVRIGNNGLTANVLQEIENSLNAHELIKIKVFGDDRDARVAMLEEICEKTGATKVHHIGKQLVIYRQAETAKIVIPK
jgi:RNA-binding protein